MGIYFARITRITWIFKKISCICHSERSEESPERTRRCFTTFSMTKEIRDQSVTIH